MIFIALALLQPVVALPIISGSAEHGAAWILRTSTIGLPAVIVSARRVVRVLFLAPLLVAITVGYLLNGVRPLSVVVHVTTLALLAEAVARLVQRAFPHPPFSRPVDDDELTKAFLAAGMLLYVSCGIVAIVVVHALYRLAGALF
jgi:hypothetical protein